MRTSLAVENTSTILATPAGTQASTEFTVLKKMWINLYKGPCLLALVSLIVIYVFGSFIPVYFSDSFSAFVFIEGAKEFGPLIGLVLYGVAVVWGAYNYYRYWMWRRGQGDSCRTCGFLAVPRNGKHLGTYYKCTSCGNHQSF